MDDRFVGKTALITGGSGGIGAATAERLASEGANVAIVDINEARARAVATEIDASGQAARAITCDVSDIDSAEAAVATCLATFGRLDILVCCAGIIRDNLVFRMSDDDWHGVLETHLTGTFAFARAAQRTMTQQRYGKMVFLSSVSALGNRGQVNYSAAKAGLQAMARTLAIELGPFGINVNAVAPGFVETDMTRATADRLGMDFAAFKASVLEQIPRRILGQPKHIAEVIAFLCSDGSEYISGQTIYAAGGPRG